MPKIDNGWELVTGKGDKEMTREWHAGGWCCVSTAGCVLLLESTGQEALKQGYACRTRELSDL